MIGRSKTISGLGVWVAAAVLVANGVLTSVNLRTIVANNGRVDHTRKVIASLEHAQSILKDAETGQRGYLLTGKPAYLVPYWTALGEIDRTLDRLADLTSDNPLQQDRIAALRRLAGEKVKELRTTVALREEKSLAAALEVVQTDRGQWLMDEIRRVVAVMEAEEDRLLAIRMAATRSATRWTLGSFIGATALALGLLAGMSSLKRREARQERRLTEAIRAERGWLSTILNSIGDAVIATDGAGRVRFLNPIAETLTGYPQSDAIGLRILDIFPIINEYSRMPVEDPIDKVMRSGTIVGLANHTLLIARDGTETPIEDSAAPIRNDQGEIIGVVMVFRDASAQRKHEEALRASENQFRTLADSIPQLAWMARADGYVSWYNRRWHDYTGKTPEDMEGWGWQSVHHPAMLPTVLERWSGSIASGEPFDMVFPLLGADGVFRDFLTRIMPVHDANGQIVHWFGTNTDISDRMRIEAELRAARDEAEHASRAKSRFLAVLSHELRTPLNPVLLATTAMLDQPTSPTEIRPTLEMIRENVMLQARLIDDLLDVMRIVRGKLPLKWSVVDCHDLIERAVAICKGEIEEKRLRLEVVLAADPHHVDADATRFQQVLWNLIKNALKFTPDGGTISIVARNGRSPDGLASTITVEVTDSGIGIEPDVLATIFDPFQQGESTITRRYGGLGLGLAISRGIVEAHGGTLNVESAGTGRGATFRVSLKVVAAPVEAVAAPVETLPAPPEELPKGLPTAPHRRILVVEDDPATLQVMERLLRKLGHEVRTAATLGAAIDVLDDGGFDLLISDIGLPDGSGLDLIRRVVAARGPVPSIALSGYGMDEDVRRSREAGFSEHMTKPIDFTKLTAIIRRITS